MYAFLGLTADAVYLDWKCDSSEMCAQKWFAEFHHILSKQGIHCRLMLDGLDEVKHFNISTFGCQGDAKVFRRFVESFAPLLLAAAQGMFKLNVYLPSCQQFSASHVLGAISRPDKVRMYELNWSPPVRATYAEFKMKQLGRHQSWWKWFTWSRRLPKFVAFVGGPTCAELVYRNVQTARQINEFISAMTQQIVHRDPMVGDKNCDDARAALKMTKIVRAENPSPSAPVNGGPETEGDL